MPSGWLRVLEAPRLERAILDAVSTRGLGVAVGRDVRIAARRDVRGAFCVGSTLHCVAFLSAAERDRLRGYLPERPSDDALVSAPGVDRDRGAQVLVLEQERFRYQPDPGRVSSREPSVQGVEDRARRMVLDWLAWLASQGALPQRSAR